MSAENRGFNRLARWYRTAEFLAFGRDLERARFTYLDRLAPCRHILVLGEGDGRFAARLAHMAPGARIRCVDSSPGMIERASRRIAGTEEAARVTFTCADALSFDPGRGAYDAAVTLFFLDCFDARDAELIVSRVDAALGPGASWLFADFVLPQSGFARARARAWLGLLYAFFRWEAGLSVRALPPSEEILGRAGWRPMATRDLQWGLIRSSLLSRDIERH
jgi:ubiquinone/menaquinone biosynthesis C-methylase UbiE